MIVREHFSIGQHSTAVFSDCERFRYRLTRTWDEALPGIAYLMLNPSTADERVNDPTIERCQRRAIASGYGSMTIANIFPIRETDSKKLARIQDLIGDIGLANQAIVDAVMNSSITICGWGKHHLEATKSRVNDVRDLLYTNYLDNRLYCLKINKDGSPQHPLYVAYETEPMRYKVEI
jgi:hypothetical protein